MINFFRSLLEKIIFWKCRTWMNENLNAPLESISFHCGLGNLVIANCLQIQGLEFYTTCVCVSTDYRTVLELKHQSSIFISTTKFIKENKIEGTLILKLAMVTVLWKNVHKFRLYSVKWPVGEVGVSLPWWCHALVPLAPSLKKNLQQIF